MLIPFPDPFTLQAKIKDARHTSSMHLFAPEGLDVFLERVSSTPLPHTYLSWCRVFVYPRSVRILPTFSSSKSPRPCILGFSFANPRLLDYQEER